MFIYLDESGDLGFDFAKGKTTRKFVVTLLVCFSDEGRRDIKKAVRRTLKNKVNRRKKDPAYAHELKGVRTTIDVKRYFLRQLKGDDWGLYALVLNKNRVEPHLRTKHGKKKLYNFLSRFLIEKLPLSNAQRNVDLVVDRSKNKEEVRDFNQYIVNQLEAMLPLNTALNISHLTSVESEQLQAVDMFSWGIFRKYECSDMTWYSEYGRKMRFETEYLREMQ